VSVRPSRLQCVTAYEIEADQLKTFVRIRYLRPRDITEHIGFPTASCAGTCASQGLQSEKRFRPVIPGYGKLATYLLNVCWFEPH
jgi:hypothetical protein